MAVPEMDDSAGTQSVLERIAAVLEVMSGAEGLTLADISRRCDIPRSSVHRILQQMVDIRWVERNDRTYRLGVGVRELGQRTIKQSPLHRAATQRMYQLRDATGFTVHFATFSDWESVNLETIWGKRSAPTFGGARQPAHATASGRLLLAGKLSTDPELAGMPELIKLTKYTITSKQLLVRELYKIRKDEVAVVRDECRLNVTTVAVALGPLDEASHTLALSGPSDVLRPHDVVPHLRAAAAHAWMDATSAVPRRRRRPGIALRSTG